MPFYYSANRQKIELTLSPDDIGINFTAGAAAPQAERAVRAAVGATRVSVATQPRRFRHVMMLHEPGAARTSFATVRAALSAKLAADVRRTMPVFTESESGLRLVATREIVVRFKPRVTAAKQNKILDEVGLILTRKNDFHGQQFIVTPATDIDEAVILELANRLSEFDDAVEYAAPNFVAECRKSAATNDPQLSEQWHLDNTGTFVGALAGEDVDALAAWDITPGGDPNIVIAIIDDGVDIRHPDLRANIWVNPDPNAPDRNGRNFFDGDFDPRPRYFNAPFNETATNDIHGTPCAGVAAAVGQNRRGVAGIAYRCRILPVKIFGGPAIATNEQV
ncbi:MAG TPA: S8 family serine peptidase, partial [Blastocatellia bacterium]|nr:S8 family serine peptidase [Blastocatellia bacterium]